MNHRRNWLAVIFLLSLVSIAHAEDFAGTYTGPTLSMELTTSGGGYTGIIRMGSKQFPLTAQAQGATLQGTFVSGNNQFPFTATIVGDDLTLTSGQAVHSLHRQRAENPLAANPLSGGEAAPAVGAPVVDASAGFTELASNQSGKTLFIQKPQATSAQAALESTLPDLAKQLGVRPHVTGAFADQKDPTRGGASFTAVVNGQNVAGMILCGRGNTGGSVVTVTYARTDATPADRAALSAALPSDTKMRTHQFPDGTGSVDLPEGWTTQNQSVIGGVQVKGPADQVVSLGVGVSVVTPNSTAVQMQTQMEQQARQMGYPAPPAMQLLVAPYTGPVEALQNLIPEISKFSVRRGGPAIALVKMLETSETPANLPGGHAALMSYILDKGMPGAAPIRFKCVAQVENYPLGGNGSDSWGAFISELAAPENHFDADIATMWAIAKSFKTNDAVVTQKSQQMIQQSNQNFAAFQKSMKDERDAFDDYRKAMDANSTARSRSNADFDEVIRGYRSVEDTTTGERTSVDLGHVDDVVNKLNEADPGRYKQIPLRDETYPEAK